MSATAAATACQRARSPGWVGAASWGADRAPARGGTRGRAYDVSRGAGGGVGGGNRRGGASQGAGQTVRGAEFSSDYARPVVGEGVWGPDTRACLLLGGLA